MSSPRSFSRRTAARKTAGPLKSNDGTPRFAARRASVGRASRTTEANGLGAILGAGPVADAFFGNCLEPVLFLGLSTICSTDPTATPFHTPPANAYSTPNYQLQAADFPFQLAPTGPETGHTLEQAVQPVQRS